MLEDLQGNGVRPKHVSESMDLSYRELAEQVPAVLYVDESDESSSAVYMSPRGEALLGYSREEWLEDPELWVRILHPGDRERVLAAHRHARLTDGPFESEYRLVAKDGSVVWVRDEAAPVGDSPGKRAGVLLDITERKRYEEGLRRSEERFRLVARATDEAVWDNDLTTGIQEWDGATEALFGYPPHSDGTGKWWEERIHPEDRGKVLSGLESVLEGAGELWEDEYRFRRADGSYAHVVDRGFVVREPSGRPTRMVGAMADVSERRRREQELRESEERFRRTFEAAAVGMAHLSPDGRWLRINDALCEISGYPRDELLKMSYTDLSLPEDLEPGEERVRRLLDDRTGSYTVERRFVRRNGSRVWVKLSVSLALKTSGDPDFLICLAEDITARKLEEHVLEPLTAREVNVLLRIVAGDTNRRIARRLRQSVGTVKLDVQKILRKLNVADRGSAACHAVDIGLVPPKDRAVQLP